MRVIVPFAPGGTLDLTGRVISQQLSEQLGKTFVVDNRAGATGMELITWFGLAGPAGMPKEIANKLHAEVVKALAVPIVKERFAGSELVGSSPAEFSKVVRDDIRLWAGIVKAAGVKPE